jgi:hypothetical protein
MEVNAMPTVKAYYDGTTLFPIGGLDILKGKNGSISLLYGSNQLPMLLKMLPLSLKTPCSLQFGMVQSYS